MIHLAWSLTERLVPRLASAVIMFVLAAQVGPTLLGYYAWLILGVTFLQTAFDTSIRQVSVMALSSEAGVRFLQRYRRIYALWGTSALSVLVLIMILLVEAHTIASLLGLLPVIAVPWLMSLSTVMIAQEQRRGGWRKLALIQFYAVLVAFLITLPLLIFVPSLLGPSVNLAVIEALIYVQLRRGGPRSVSVGEGTGASAAVLGRRFREACVYSVLGWGQSQLDRVAVGALGGSALLGLYTFSWSISRSLGDAVSNGAINILRAKVFAETITPRVARSIVANSLRQTLILVFCGVAVVYAANYWILPHFLGAEWRPALNAAYILVLCTVPQSIASASSVLLMYRGKMKAGSMIRIIGLACAVPIGLCAVVDLRLGASAALVREILMCVISMFIVRRQAPWPTIVVGLASVLIILAGSAGIGLFSQ